MTLRKSSKLPDVPLSIPSSQKTLWRGLDKDGISQTMLSRYLVCPERFRIMYIEGLQPIPTFNPLLEFGNLWHMAEEAFAATDNEIDTADGVTWDRAVYNYANALADKYPFQKDQIIHWLKITIALFPAYIDYWKEHPDTVKRVGLLQEEKFKVAYDLPSGRLCNLRGKWDGVDLIGKAMWDGVDLIGKGIYLFETKTKSQIDRMKIDRQLRYDLQTMLYCIALSQDTGIETLEKVKGWNGTNFKTPIRGVRYNVIRRSSHKTPESMMKKVEEDIAADRAADWFCRWNVEISAHDIATFKIQSLNPILENLADDFAWWDHCIQTMQSPFNYQTRHIMFPNHQRRHFTMPYIGYNPLSEGRESDIDSYLQTGSEIGLERVTHDNLFPEL